MVPLAQGLDPPIVCKRPGNDFNSFVIFFSPQTPHLGGPGLPYCGLSEDECQLVQ